MDEGNMQSNSKFCTNCGTPVFEGQVFCPNCGYQLTVPQPQNSTPKEAQSQNAWQQPQGTEPINTWQQPQSEQPQNAWQQPQGTEPINAWQQPQGTDSQNAWQQPQNVEPQNVWQQPQSEQSQNAWQQPQDVQPQNVWQQPQSEQPQNAWQQPQSEQPQNAWQQPQGAESQNQQYGYNSYNQPQAGTYYQQGEQQQYTQYDYGQSDSKPSYNGGQQPPNSGNPYEKPQKEPMDPKKKKKRIILFSCLSAGAVILIGLAIFLFNYFSYTRLNASEIYKITYEGVNGTARASIELDQENKDIKKLVNDAASGGDLKAYRESLKKAMAISTINYVMDKDEDLSNGDVIKVTVEYDSDKLKEEKIKLTHTSFDITVEDLKKAEKIDLFDNVVVTYEGVSGYGTAILNTDNASDFVRNYVDFSFKEDYTQLKNGDTITLVADVNEDTMNEEGYTTDTFEKEYTVEGLTEAKTYDVFKDIKLIYSGASPKLSVELDTSACETDIKDNVNFNLDVSENLKNGDSITVTASFDAEYMRSKGYDITEDTKAYTVEGQAELMTEFNKKSIPQLDNRVSDLVATWMKANGDNYLFQKDLSSELTDGAKLGDVKNQLVERYYAVKADEQNYNIYATINKCTYTIVKKDGKSEKKETYVMAVFTNLGKDSAGAYKWDESEDYAYADDLNDLIAALNNIGYDFSKVEAE